MLLGSRVELFEQLRCCAAFVAADSNSHNVAILQLNCLLEYRCCSFNPKVEDRVKDPEQRNSEVALAASASSFEALKNRVEILLTPLNHSYRDIHLRMQHILGMQAIHKLVGDQLEVFGCAQPFGD